MGKFNQLRKFNGNTNASQVGRFNSIKLKARHRRLRKSLRGNINEVPVVNNVTSPSNDLVNTITLDNAAVLMDNDNDSASNNSVNEYNDDDSASNSVNEGLPTDAIDFTRPFHDIGFSLHFNMTASGRKSNDMELKTMLNRMISFLTWTYLHMNPNHTVADMNILDWLKAIIKRCNPALPTYCKYMEDELQLDAKTIQNVLYHLKAVTTWFVQVTQYDGLVSADLSQIEFFFTSYIKAYGRRKGNKWVDNSFENKVRTREMPPNGMETLNNAVTLERSQWLGKFLG